MEGEDEARQEMESGRSLASKVCSLESSERASRVSIRSRTSSLAESAAAKDGEDESAAAGFGSAISRAVEVAEDRSR